METGPVRFRFQPINLAAERITTDLDPAVVFLNGFLDRQVSTGDFGIKPKLDVLAPCWITSVLDKDGEMAPGVEPVKVPGYHTDYTEGHSDEFRRLIL